MEEMKIATIVQLMNDKAAQKGITTQIQSKDVVELPNNSTKGFMGIPHWEVYAARVEEYVCLLYWYPDGRANVYIHC